MGSFAHIYHTILCFAQLHRYSHVLMYSLNECVLTSLSACALECDASTLYQAECVSPHVYIVWRHALINSVLCPSSKWEFELADEWLRAASDIRYLTWITYLFPQTCCIVFPQVVARQSAGARTAIRRSPVRQCMDRPRGNARIVHVAMCGSSADLYNCPRMNAEAYVLD